MGALYIDRCSSCLLNLKYSRVILNLQNSKIKAWMFFGLVVGFSW